MEGVPSGTSFNYKKCRFECRLSVGLLISNCCMCSHEMEVEVMNIIMQRNVTQKTFVIFFSVILGIQSKIA